MKITEKEVGVSAYKKNVQDFLPESQLIYLNDGSPRIIYNEEDISTILMPPPKDEITAWFQASEWVNFKKADLNDILERKYEIVNDINQKRLLELLNNTLGI